MSVGAVSGVLLVVRFSILKQSSTMTRMKDENERRAFEVLEVLSDVSQKGI